MVILLSPRAPAEAAAADDQLADAAIVAVDDELGAVLLAAEGETCNIYGYCMRHLSLVKAILHRTYP
jgi:hypothetical protein